MHILKAVLTTAKTRFYSVLSLSMLLIFCKRTIGDCAVRSVKNIHSQPDIVGYWIRTEVGSVFGSTCFYNNNNNKSMQMMQFFSNFVPIVYIQCILPTTNWEELNSIIQYVQISKSTSLQHSNFFNPTF